jgi:hypothetical protein
MERACRIFLIYLVLLASSGKLYSHTSQAYYNSVKGNDFSVFEENGKVGLKDEQGSVLIPAQYDAIGWSNGQFSLVNNVTGYRSHGQWGLINIQNNRITKPAYVDLSPGEGSLLVARKKIHGTVRIQTGCINTAGKEVIPFQYDGLRITSFRAIVYMKNGHQFKHGLIDFENRLLIPIQYQNIYPLGSLRYGVENFDHKTAIFSEDGKQMTSFIIDSLSAYKKDYAVIYQNQRQGLIDRQGQLRLEPTYREIRVNDDGTIHARQADAWLWLDGENKLVKQFNADSITVINADRLKVQTAGKALLTDQVFNPVNARLFSFVGPFKNGKAFFRSDGRAGIIDLQGNVIIRPVYNDLLADRHFFRARQLKENNNRWIILDSAGNALTAKSYDHIGAYNGRYFPVKHRGYWGLVDKQGKEVVACVHDSIVQQLQERVVVKFKGKYGIVSTGEDWIVTPQPNRLQLIDDSRYLEFAPNTTFLKSPGGQIIYFSDNTLEVRGDHLLEHLPSGATWRIDMNGLITDRTVQPEDVEEIFPESEGLRAIRKDERYGFIDSRGRLRIANRYEDVKPFSNTLAAAKIRGKWGFINHEDRIAIQPVYDEVDPFRDGYALVMQKNFFGVLDTGGRLLLPVRYDSIVMLPGKRFQLLQNGLWGLADGTGKMIINPKFDRVTDLNNGYVIIQREGKFGLLTLQGISTIPQIYDGLVYDPYHNQYIALKKAVWEVMKF